MGLLHALDARQVAEVAVEPSRSRAVARVAMTPSGLLAIGGMVGLILLGTSVIVLAAGRARGKGA